MRAAKTLLLCTLLLSLAACGTTTYVDDVSDEDADAEDFNPCGAPCPAGTVCRSLRCVAVADAAVDATRDLGAGSDVTVDIAGFDATPVTCCPIDRFTTCGCVRVGGAQVAGRACRQVCGNGYPEFWRRTTDTSGCPVWLPSGLSCKDAGEALDGEADDASAPQTDLGIMQ